MGVGLKLGLSEGPPGPLGCGAGPRLGLGPGCWDWACGDAGCIGTGDGPGATPRGRVSRLSRLQVCESLTLLHWGLRLQWRWCWCWGGGVGR
jgi:hypothetical protein